MYDPDPASPVLRLGDMPTRPVQPAPRTLEQTERWLAEAEQAMEEAIKRWSSAYVDWTAMRAQARPIPASQPPADGAVRYEPLSTPFLDAVTNGSIDPKQFDWNNDASQPTKQTDAQHLARYTAAGSRPLVFRANGKVEALG